jgi:hypothetical protein
MTIMDGPYKRSCLIGTECSSLHSFYFVLNSHGMGLYTPKASSGYASDLVDVCKCNEKLVTRELLYNKTSRTSSKV